MCNLGKIKTIGKNSNINEKIKIALNIIISTNLLMGNEKFISLLSKNF